MKYHSAMEPSDCIYAYHIHNGTWVSFANRHTTKAITAETGTATTGRETGREEALAHAQVVRCCDTIRTPGGSVLYCSCRTSAATWQPANGSTVLDRRGGETVGLPGARRRSRPLLSRAAPFVREGRSALCRDGALPGLFPVRTPPAGRTPRTLPASRAPAQTEETSSPSADSSGHGLIYQSLPHDNSSGTCTVHSASLLGVVDSQAHDPGRS